MKLSPQHTEAAILAEIGARLAYARLRVNLSQQDVADLAGLAKRTVERIESGQPSSTENFVRLLRALGLIEQLNGVLPEVTASPMEQLKRGIKHRRRAPSARRKSPPVRPTGKWVWGDER